MQSKPCNDGSSNRWPRHEDALFLSVDGNFRLVRKVKPGDKSDVSLSDGQSFFVHENDLKAYLADVEDDGDVSTQCILGIFYHVDNVHSPQAVVASEPATFYVKDATKISWFLELWELYVLVMDSSSLLAWLIFRRANGA